MGVQCWGRKGMQVWSLEASPSPAFQFSYTAVFGAYTAFLFIRTGWSQSLTGPLGLKGPQEWVGKWESVYSRSNKFLLPQSLRQAEPGSSAWCCLRGGSRGRV